MTNRKRCIPGGLLFLPLLFLFLMMPGQVKAAQSSCEVTIPVQIEVSGDKIPDGEIYQVTMEAVTKDAPMPAQKVQERKNAGTVSFGPMTYTVPGDYQYKISQTAGKTDRFTYDTSTYDVTVRVVNAENGTLKAEMWAVKNGSDTKSGTITFGNHYDTPKSNGPKKHHHSSKTEETTTTPMIVQTLQTLASPKTGDTANVLLWGAFAAAAVLGVAVMIFMTVRNGKREE